MNKKQGLTIENLKEAFFNTFSYGAPEKYELKKVNIWESCGDVYIWLEIGLIGEENIMDKIYCRNNTRVFVGPRGGYFNYRPKSGKKCTLNTLQAVYCGFHCDQKAKRV